MANKWGPERRLGFLTQPNLSTVDRNHRYVGQNGCPESIAIVTMKGKYLEKWCGLQEAVLTK